MIGLSLSFCIKDILSGKHKISDVKYIITSVMPINGIDEIINEYMRVYWRDYSKAQVLDVINQLELRHPRLEDPEHYPCIIDGKWVNSEDEIIWQRPIM